MEVVSPTFFLFMEVINIDLRQNNISGCLTLEAFRDAINKFVFHFIRNQRTQEIETDGLKRRRRKENQCWCKLFKPRFLFGASPMNRRRISIIV